MKTEAEGRRARRYRQTARAAATERTAQRIAEAFAACVNDRWFDDVTLDEVARLAGVTVRTIVRRFGGKVGLAREFIHYVGPRIAGQRTAPPGDVDGAVDRALAIYEQMGDGVIRNLAQEDRQPALRFMLARGRSGHREITAQIFASWIEPLGGRAGRRLLDALVIATDVYAWKLLRRDMGRSRGETRATIRAMVRAILAQAGAGRSDTVEAP